MKKSLLALLSVFILLFTACDTWMQDDDFFADIESDVKVANAPQISVYVRYALTRQGKTDPDGPATFKVEIPQEVSATTETEYGFVRWAAFTTDFIATGDNQSKNKDIYFIDEEDYNSRLLPHEIKAPAVVFEKPTSATTKVTINENRNDLFLVPIVAQRPAVSLTIPAKGSSGVVRNMSVRINFTKPMDEASFKNEAGEFDKITVTQGIQSFTADGDIEINSEDITDYFEAPVFSKNKKMLTLKFKPERLSEGYSSQSSVNITISKDVKDIYGFAMTDDDKISFSVGSYKDTLAPRITQLSAGRTGSDFHRFLGVYKDAGTINSVGAATKMTLEGAANAPLNDIDASFYDTYIPYRVTDKVIIRVLAEDISGSGSGQSQTGIETDVAMVGMRAYHMYNSDGSTSTFTYTPATADTAAQAFKFLAVNYQPQMNLTTSVPGAYKSLIQAVNENIEGTENDFAFDKGCLLEMDVSDLPDGLIRIDVAAVDMVQNSGFSDGGALSEEYGNAWASLFVIKDTTPPDASANSSFVSVDTSASTLITADHYFNEATYSNVKIAHDLSSLADAGHARLRSPHDSLKWIVKPTAETNWISTINASNAAWLPVTSDYAPFPLPTNQGEVHYTYALMDDVGNISAASAIPPIYYDSVAPVVGNLSFVADEGYTAGVAKDNILDEQTLIIPITEETSGLKSIEVKVRKAGAAEDYASPLSYSGLVVTTAGQAVPYTLDEAKKVLTFTTPQTNFNSDVRIKGIKLSDDLGEQGSFEVNVVVKDAAAAASVHEIQPAVKAISNTDSVPVVIDQIYIPNLKETVRHGGTTPEYWVDYTSTNAQALTKPAGANPRTDVYIKFTEATSGARIFDFAGSSMHLTADSMIYKINEADGAIIGGTAIAATPDLANNRLLINSAADAAANFAGGQMTVKITQVELASEGTASTIALKIHDTATNPSVVNGTIKSNEGGLSLASPAITVSSAGFKFDTASPSASTPHGSLADRASAGPDGTTAAETGYTNEVYVDYQIILTPTASGIEGLTIVGDASFDSTTTISEGANSRVYYDIVPSTDNKTVRFNKAENDSSHVVLGSGTTVTLTISNLKLTAGDGTSGDGTKTVTVKPAGFGGVKDATGSSDYIILDRQPPVWNSANTGLYTTTDNSVLDGHVYPHPSASPYGIPGSQVLNATDTSALYFYRKADISIRPDVIDDNKKDDGSLITYTHGGSALTNSAAYLYTPETGTFTATATDRAGNKSTIKTFNIVADSSFANSSDELTAIDNYMTLYKPEGAFIHRNAPASNSLRYVIKNADYQVRVKLGGNAPEPGEEAINGSAPAYTSGTAYNRKDTTTISTKIEKYYVSTTSASPSYDSENWKSYTPGTTYTFGNIGTSVDSNGTIIINLPHADCNPISLHLLDACGNSTSVLVKAASADSYGIQWELDSIIGSESYTGTAQIQSGTYTSHSDVSFYNAPVTLKIDDLTESCKFPTGGVVNLTDSSFTYSIKSRIIAWADSGVPGRDYFGNNDGTYKTGITPPPAASDWYFVKQASNGSLSVQNNFPQLSSTARYKLFIILEDTVGNYEIRQIRRASNGDIVVSTSTPSSSEIENWYYDATPPEVTAATSMTYNKINYNSADNMNYYSSNSSVSYTVSDSGSGVKGDGQTITSDSTYPGFGQRTVVNKNYSLNGVSADVSTKKIIIPASYIKDFAGNQYTSDIELNNGGSTQWKELSTCPTLADNAAMVVNKLVSSTTPNLGLTGNEATSTNSDESAGGQKLEIKAKWFVTNITLKLYTDTDTPYTDLLGWVVSTTALSPSTSDFYSEVSPDVTWDLAGGYWKYEYTKAFSASVWWQDTPDKYFYPVNKAGLICQTPVKVIFNENTPPAIVNGRSNTGYSYSSNAEINDTYLAADVTTDYIIKAAGKGTSSAINYTRDGAQVTFTTTGNPTVCRFVTPGADGVFGMNQTTQTTDDVSIGSDITLTPDAGTTSTYTIDLPTTLSNSVIGIQLSRGTEEDSETYPLNGPAENNRWTFDNTIPGVTLGDIKVGSSSGAAPATFSGDSTETKYIKNENVFIGWTLSDASDVTPHYQWKTRIYTDPTDNNTSGSWTSWSGWSDITASYVAADGSGITFPSPERKTEYKFRLVDIAGNISTETTAVVRLQCDDAAPGGTVTYTTNNVSSSVNLKNQNLDTSGGIDSANNGAEIRVIKYSSDDSSQWFINKIVLDLSNITDAVNSIPRSGVQKFVILKKEGSGSSSPDQNSSSNGTMATIDLSDNAINTEFTYYVNVYDNIDQVRTLLVFKTQADQTPPVLTFSTFHSDDAKVTAAVSSANTSDTTKYLKGDKAVITFTTDDPYATYRVYNSTADTALTSTQIRALTASDWTDIETSSESLTTTSLTYSISAPDTKTYYYFMAEDPVGNKSYTGPVRLQRDKWAPAVPATENSGLIGYTLYSGSNPKTLTDGLETTGTDSNGNPTVEIKYSSNSGESGSANHITKIRIDVSKVTDTVDGIDRSGIEDFYVNGTAVSSIKTDGYYEITLTNGETAQSSYIISVKDNADNDEKILRTFILKPNADLPNFALAGTTGTTTRVMKKDNTEGASLVSCEAKTSSTENEVYYLNKDKAVINFTKTHTDITSYQVSKSTDGGTTWSDWEPITPTVDTSDETSHKVSYEFDTPTESTTYKFKAVDDVLNEKVISTTITLQKDTDEPINNVSYLFKKEEPAGTISDAIAATYYNDPAAADATTRPIIYNADEINRFELNLSAITDAISGIRRFWLTIGSTEIELTDSTTPAISSNKCLIEIATADNTTQTYIISAEDWAGNKQTVKTFTLTSDAAGPGFTMGTIQAIDSANQTNNAWQNTTSGTYYLRGEKAKFNFTKTGTDIVKYEVKAVAGGTGGYEEISQTQADGTPNPNLTIENSTVTYKFSAPETATTYTFKFTDRVGHVQEMTTSAVTLVQDTTAPALGSSFDFAGYKTSETDPVQIVDATHKVGAYTVSTDANTGTITINFNPTKVNKLVFALSNIVEAGSGLEKYYYKDGSDHEMTGDNGNEMELSSTWSNITYEIIAKDNAGNVSETLKTIVFNADSTGPVIEATDYTRSNGNTVKQINCYTSSVGNIPYAKWMRKFTLQKTNYYASGTQIMFVKNSLDGAVQYQLIQTRTTDAIPATADTAEVPASDGYTAVAATTENSWQTLTEGTGENAGKYIFTLPDITTPYTRLSFFFRDVLGNVSGPYYLGNNTIDTTTNPITNQIGIQWWLTKVEPLSADNINITSVTWNNNGTSASGWGGKLHDYIVTLTLPAGTLVNSVFLAPKAGNANTGVVFSSNLPQGISNSLQFSGYTNESDNINNIKGKYDGEGYIVLPSSAESTTGTVTMVIYPHDVEDANKGNILVKFNVQNADSEGVSKQIFPPENLNINRLGNLGFTLGDSSGESAGARLVQFFNSFVSKDEEALTSTAVDSSIAEKASKTKKAAKKAKKAAKKNSKKVVSTSSTTAGSGSTSSKPVMSVDSAEILAQNEKSTLPEIAVATETVVNEIAGVAEKVSGEAEVVSIRPTGYSTTESSAATTAASTDSEAQSAGAPEAAADKRTPSRSASIVIMLAILSSFGAVWYLQRNRKK